MLDPASDRPLWQQVLDDLERRLAQGEFGERFPTDRELVDHYGVSRQTVREATQRLKARGLIERVRGRGSVVRPQAIVPALGTLYSLFRAVEAEGMVQSSEVLSIGLRADAEVAEALEQPADAELFHLERLRLADGEPLALDTVWLRADLGRPLLDVDFGRTAVYDELAETGVVLTRGEELVTPLLPDEDLCDVLGLGEREAVLRVERRAWVGDDPVELRVTLVRGARFALRATWPADGGPSFAANGG